MGETIIHEYVNEDYSGVWLDWRVYFITIYEEWHPMKSLYYYLLVRQFNN